MRGFAATALAVLACGLGSAVTLGADRIENPIAEFAGLDKITGRIIKFEVKINETVQFGALQVTPRVCLTRPATDQPQTTGFVEVDEITLKNEIRRIFGGWMFAASPGLNAVEHPIYDIWLTNCKGTVVALPVPGPQAGEGDPAVQNAPPPQRRGNPPRQPPASTDSTPPAPQPSTPRPPFTPTNRPQPRLQPGVPFDPAQLPPR